MDRSVVKWMRVLVPVGLLAAFLAPNPAGAQESAECGLGEGVSVRVYEDINFKGRGRPFFLTLGSPWQDLGEMQDQVSSWVAENCSHGNSYEVCLIDHVNGQEKVLQRVPLKPQKDLATPGLGPGDNKADRVKLC